MYTVGRVGSCCPYSTSSISMVFVCTEGLDKMLLFERKQLDAVAFDITTIVDLEKKII